jgi:hypothetical protein
MTWLTSSYQLALIYSLQNWAADGETPNGKERANRSKVFPSGK